MATKEERIAEYEEIFADRYTEKDESYQKHVSQEALPPPVIQDWLSLHNNLDRRHDDRGRSGRERGRDSRFPSNRDRKDRYERRYTGGQMDFRDREPREERGPRNDRDRNRAQYKSSGYYEMYY